MNFKPMLSASLDDVDISTLRYPKMISPKLDGIRCLVWNGIAYSRNAKPIRNRFVQAVLSKHHNLDGELIVGSATEGDVLNRSKAVTAFSGEPDFTFHVFDHVERGDDPTFQRAYNHLLDKYGEFERIKIVPHLLVTQSSQLLTMEQQWLDQGYEGLMARDPEGPYKHGRSTLREEYLLKLKRFTDGEAEVVALEEALHNANSLERDELGRAKRSSHAENLQPAGMVGVIVCNTEQWGLINVAPGTMTHNERIRFWNNPRELVGKTIHWRSFGYGLKDAPRFARYYGIREDV